MVLAVDIGGTKFAAGLVSPRGELLDRAVVLVDQNVGPEAHFKALAGIVEQQLDAADRHGVRVASRRRRLGRTDHPPLRDGVAGQHPGVAGVPAAPPARRAHRRRASTASSTARRWPSPRAGRARPRAVDDYCVLTVSTGIGGGIVLDGELLDGASANAGHVGHIIVEPNGRRCGCGARGCLEAEASGLAIEAITGRSPTEPTYEIMQRTGRLVGRAVASLCTLLDLELVVVGGGVALGFAATFFNAAQEELSTTARLPYTRHARITPTRLGDRGPLIGAGAVGIRGMRRARS